LVFSGSTAFGGSAWLAVVCRALTACSSDPGGSDASSPATGDSSTTVSDAGSEAPSSCPPLLQPRAGTYPVTGPANDPASRGATTASHQRGNVVVAADGAIDFDTGLAQPAKSISVCYDRTKQDTDRRVQISYGADDNELVVNLYLTAAGVVDEIQYRNRNQNVNVRVLVGPPTR
jgi:hypothetical protein